MAEQIPDMSSGGGSSERTDRWARAVHLVGVLGKRVWYGKASVADHAEEGRAGSLGSDEDRAAVREGEIAAVEFPDTRFGRFDRRFNNVCKWLSYLAGLALLAIVVICVVDVLGWKLFGKPVPSSTDFIAYMNVVLVFLAVAYVQTDRGSTSIELVQKRFPLPLKVTIRTLAYFLGFACSMFLVYRGYFKLELQWTTHDSAAGVWKFPLWPFQVCLLVGCFFLGLGFVVTGIRDLVNFKNRRGAYASVLKKRKTKTVVPPATEQR